MACRLCVIYVSEDNDSDVYAMITPVYMDYMHPDVPCPQKGR